MVVLGLAVYHLIILSEMHTSMGRIVWFKEYFLMRPFKSILSVLGAIIGYFVCLYTLPESVTPLTEILAYLGTGIAPYGIIDKIAKYGSANRLPQPSESVDRTKEEVFIKKEKEKPDAPTEFIRKR